MIKSIVMKTVKRYDLGKFAEATKTPQGFLKMPVFATKVGIFKYLTGDGRMIREFRPPDEVFKEESLASLSGAPITLRHPSEMVTPGNFQKYAKGYLLEGIEKSDDKVSATAIISSQDAIDAIEKEGLRQVSCGYLADLDETPGEWNGQPYDVIQRNIKYNHLAIVDKGRAGPEVRLRLDAADAVEESLTNQEKKPMVKVMLGGQEFEVDPKLAEALQAHMAQMEDGYKKNAAESGAVAEKAKEEMQGKMDALQSRLDSAPGEVKPEVIRAAVKARLEMERVASVLKVEKFDELSDVELMKASILKDSPQAVLEGKSEHYVAARFDAVSEKLKESKAFISALGQGLVAKSKTDSVEIDSNDARKKMMERDNQAWNKAAK